MCTLAEKYFTDIMASSHKFSQIGTYMEKGNHNGIYIVAVNETEKRILFAEVKRNK